MFSCESLKVFKNIYFTKHFRVTPLCFVSFSEILVKKAFWMIIQYFRNSSCKPSLWIVRLLQSLSAYFYLKMPKLLQCHRQPKAPRKRAVPSVNDHPAIVDIFRKFYENGPCVQRPFSGNQALKGLIKRNSLLLAYLRIYLLITYLLTNSIYKEMLVNPSPLSQINY